MADGTGRDADDRFSSRGVSLVTTQSWHALVSRYGNLVEALHPTLPPPI